MNSYNEKQKVLMIDDEQDIIQFFKKAFLNFKHIEFLTAADGLEGIEIALEQKPRVVMIDLRMPGMSGDEAVKSLKEKLPDTKFIVITGWEDGETQRKLEEEIGVDAFFAKPIDFEKVITRVMSLLMVKG